MFRKPALVGQDAESAVPSAYTAMVAQIETKPCSPIFRRGCDLDAGCKAWQESLPQQQAL